MKRIEAILLNKLSSDSLQSLINFMIEYFICIDEFEKCIDLQKCEIKGYEYKMVCITRYWDEHFVHELLYLIGEQNVTV